MKHRLEVGDIIYQKDEYGIYRYVINRVTKTLAISNSWYRFVRDIENSVIKHFPHDTSYDAKVYKLETSALKEEYEIHNLIYTIKEYIENSELYNLTIKELKTILEILEH